MNRGMCNKIVFGNDSDQHTDRHHNHFIIEASLNEKRFIKLRDTNNC